jgi:murein DD-endopeptidase MepM/ murein hydrolase activator NlpD
LPGVASPGTLPCMHLLVLVALLLPALPGPTISALAVSALPASGSVGFASVGSALAVPVPTAYGWPLDVPRVVRRFDPPPQPWAAGHRGVDLASPPGAVVHAAGPGTIVFAGQLAGRGVVSIQHPNGLRTTYEPVDVDPELRAGDAVTAAESIGALAAGHPGCPAAACLHWGLRLGEQYLDPLTLLGLGRVRLLPLGT